MLAGIKQKIHRPGTGSLNRSTRWMARARAGSRLSRAAGMPAMALKPPGRCAMIHAMADDHPAPIDDDAMKGVRYAVCQTLLPELRHPGGRQALLAAQLVG
jgi:hypothetical protein